MYFSTYLCRFGANSPGDRPGKFARSRPAQPELHKQLVSGQRAGEHAGEQCNIAGNSATYQPLCTPSILVSFLNWTHCFCCETGWWAEPCVEWKGSITSGEVQLPCGDDGGTSQRNYCKYFVLLSPSYLFILHKSSQILCGSTPAYKCIDFVHLSKYKAKRFHLCGTIKDAYLCLKSSIYVILIEKVVHLPPVFGFRSTTSMPTSSWTKRPWNRRRKRQLSASLGGLRTPPHPLTLASWRRGWREPRSTWHRN